MYRLLPLIPIEMLSLYFAIVGLKVASAFVVKHAVQRCFCLGLGPLIKQVVDVRIQPDAFPDKYEKLEAKLYANQ